MNKPFLLIAGEDYYPESGINNWIDRFETAEEAAELIECLPKTHSGRFKIKGSLYDWHCIVNLETWKRDDSERIS